MLIKTLLPPIDFKCIVCDGPFHPLLPFFRSNGLHDHISIKILLFGDLFPNCQCDHCYQNELRNNLCPICHFGNTCPKCGDYYTDNKAIFTLCPKCEIN